MPANVSVMIPSYNCAAYIAECVESVVCQGAVETEISGVDDGSADNTKAVRDPYGRQGKIRYYYQENSGPCIARNMGICSRQQVRT